MTDRAASADGGEAGGPVPPADRSDQPAADRDRRETGDRNLAVAIAVGVVLVGLFIGSVLWDPAAFTTLVGVLIAAAVLESGRVVRGAGRELAVPVVLAGSLLMLAGAHAAGPPGQLIGVLVLFVGAVVWELLDPARRRVVDACGTTLLLGLWIGLPASFAALLVTRPRDGAVAVIAVVGAAVLADIGAYATGSLLGRHLLVPSVSPNKTWEGLAGGLVLPAVVAAPLLPWLSDLFTPASAVAVALLAGLGAFVGDLVESMIKRDLGVKDLGAVLPGHGGVLDRVDGILLALPVGYYAVELVV